MPGGRPPVDPKIRFLSKVEKVQSGCHEWQAGLARGGYGKFRITKTVQAHQAAYLLFNGPIPANMCVMHICDNRKCVNPAHLRLGSIQENICDMDQKGRRGTKSPFNKSQVKEIFDLLNKGWTQQRVADKFGVRQPVISRIKLGKTFKFKE